ncbi:Rrf2 family transcriptional regulator [Treponema rectale]|uniref:Rrf2 family protein n=1 Tax=Treponema rectale TaxID=744512 RepID=A0A840SIF9_9SPIR|nr:Rrf2 family transcriptional regulator [Treponema rectale]MBB5219293.1 Rrf2 family protein [Treponema rectale]QOS40822.1 Rrf2 family transcriptional regulator [Treponema rectale]
MKISTRGKYALRFMFYMAEHGKDGFIALKDVSDYENISLKYLEQIAALLSKAGLLVSVRGPQGGYKLAKSPDRYTALDIIRVTEGDLSPVAETAGDGEKESDRIINEVLWKGLKTAVDDFLGSVTLEDLVNKSKTMEDFVYMI